MNELKRVAGYFGLGVVHGAWMMLASVPVGSPMYWVSLMGLVLAVAFLVDPLLRTRGR